MELLISNFPALIWYLQLATVLNIHPPLCSFNPIITVRALNLEATSWK